VVSRVVIERRTSAHQSGTVKRKLTFLLLAWLAAFLIVIALFEVLGSELQDLALAPRALVISGVLVLTMTQVVIPLINRLLQRVF
jgi:antibiotic biosynthesis monooxygenase (ABM) superfamily enzyme